ncbi:hypothetical protein FRB90_005442 [Tulasnella sp. 427]|nr:hypothetical protein FRB90_005442 [Tulasnella sp. 427]
MPRIDTKTPIKLVLDPGLPRRLIDELHQFTDRLTEDRLDDLKLQRAELAVETALEISGDCSIESGTLGIAASYRNGQRFLTLDPDFGWFVGGKQINVFEHKAPKDFDRHSSTLLRMASQGQTLKLGMKPEKGASLVSKAILTSIVEEVEYCVVLSMESFIIVRLVQNPTTGLRQARISTVIPLTSQATPIISLMVALILQSKPNTRAPADPDVSSQPTPSGSLETSVIGSWASTNQTDNEYPGLYSRGEHLSVFRTARAHEYWEPENVSEISLATMMKSTDGISVCWDMKPFSREIFRPIRRDDSTVWSSLPSEVVPRLKPSPESDRSTESLERPSRIPFVLRLTSTVGQGAVGTVYKGHFLGHPVPLIAKLLPLEQMDLELEIWKKLQHLAGTGVPGLFGAYALERQDEHEATGALIQQFVGKTLPNVYPQTFSPLTFDQR